MSVSASSSYSFKIKPRRKGVGVLNHQHTTEYMFFKVSLRKLTVHSSLTFLVIHCIISVIYVTRSFLESQSFNLYRSREFRHLGGQSAITTFIKLMLIKVRIVMVYLHASISFGFLH